LAPLGYCWHSGGEVLNDKGYRETGKPVGSFLFNKQTKKQKQNNNLTILFFFLVLSGR